MPSPAHVACPRCPTRWAHREAVGHCAACHRTFIGVDAFDRHQLAPTFACVDPATLTTGSGAPMFEHVPATDRLQTDDAWRIKPTEAQIASHQRFLDRLRAQREAAS